MTAVMRRTVVVAGATALAAGGAAWWRFHRDASALPAIQAASMQSAPIVRTDLSAREQIPGTLGFTAPWRLVHPGPAGVLTRVATPGTLVRRGQMVYEVDGVAVLLLHGSRPVWREFAPHMTAGDDVRQLGENLAGLGFAITPDRRFTTATEGAIRIWQRRLGRTVTGRLALGSVVFAPGDVRILQSLVPLGGRVGPEPVLRIASTDRGVTAALPLAHATQVKIGGEVEVTLPGGQRTAGTIAAIGDVTDTTNGAGDPAATTIPMMVTLKDPSVAGELDQVPVQVATVVVERKGVLAVPVTALSAAAAGGYELVVVDAEGRHVIPVRVGLVDERAGLVEITGTHLAEGMRVEVPSP